MGNGAQSKYQTHVFTDEKQLWCSCCYKSFDQPVKLGCGHKVCGPNSKNKCAETVLEKRKCLVANCEYKLPADFDKSGFKTAAISKVSEYDVAFQLDLDDGPDEAGPSTSRDPPPTIRGDQKTLKTGPKGFELVDNVYGNCRKKLLVIGKTGTGKSTLCNVIAGLDPSCDAFPVSSQAESCTQTTQFGNIRFNGDAQDPISLIDTIGFSDPDNDEDAHVISDLVVKLRTKCDYVNLFVIVVNGQNPRLDGSLVGMIRIFEEMFGEKFWKQVVVVFSRLPMDERSKSVREKTTKLTDDERAKKYIETVEKKFPKGKGLRYLLIDAWHQDFDQDEKESFENAVTQLRDMLEKAPKLETELVQKVETEHAKLKKTIAEQHKQLLEVHKLRQQDKEERVKEYERMKNEFDEKMKYELDEYKQQHEREREAERKERMKERDEMEKRHLEQLAQLLAQRGERETTYNKKESDLRLQLDLKLDQKQREQEEMKQTIIKQSEDKQKNFESQLKKLQEQQESLLQRFQQQGETDQKLRKQVESFKTQQQQLKEKHDEEKQRLEAEYMAKSENFEKEKQKLSKDFEQRTNQLQAELEKLKTETEVEVRTKQLKDIADISKSISLRVGKITETSKERFFDEDDGWREKAYDILLRAKENYWTKCDAIRDMLNQEYPDSHWSVFVAEQRNDYDESRNAMSIMSNGEREGP